MLDVQRQIETAAQELAAIYNSMKYGIGSTKRYSVSEINALLHKAEENFQESYKIQMRERFHVLVGLDGERGRAHDKLRRDFPG